jgi:hypothetical protein
VNNFLDIALAARSFQLGRAVRSATVRHRRLVDAPLAVVLWQLGAEPFSAAGLGWGSRPGELSLAVAGDPRNRDLAFGALLPFAHWFNDRFEGHAARREPGKDGEPGCALTAPQVVVANSASADLLGRLGRRLAYLGTAGRGPDGQALVRLGRHLLFLRDHAAVAGQQLIVPLTELLNAHWATAQSAAKRESLAALDAWIDPPAGSSGFEAAARAEALSAGPVLPGDGEEDLQPLVERFNRQRSGRTEPETVRPLLAPFEAFYRPLVRDAWALLWRCWARERALAEAGSVARRWRADREAYTWHIDWLNRGGLRRTRPSARQAAATLHRLERACERLEAEEACDDPLRLLPALLTHQAACGQVVRIDWGHQERAKKRQVARPLVVLASARPCLMVPGKKLWWTEEADGREYLVQAVDPLPGGGARVTLVLQTSRPARLPTVGQEACFSVYSTGGGYVAPLPRQEPWTHTASVPLPAPGDIEEETEGQP